MLDDFVQLHHRATLKVLERWEQSNFELQIFDWEYFTGYFIVPVVLLMDLEKVVGLYWLRPSDAHLHQWTQSLF